VIAAVADPRGLILAQATLREMFNRAGLEAAACAQVGSVAVGATSSPLCTLQVEPVVAAWFGPVEDSSRVSHGLRRTGAVIVASADGDLLLARGPFGGRPLYYARDERCGAFLVCSRIEPIVAMLSSGGKLDVDRLAAIIASESGADASRTHFSSVTRVRSCEVIRVRPTGSVASTFVPVTPEARTGTAEALARELREEIFAAVERAVGRFRHVGVMAGGGLDSSGIVAALALRTRSVPGSKVSVVAMDFAGEGDDRPHLSALARAFELEPLRIRPRDAAAMLPEAFVADAAPHTWPTSAGEILMGHRAHEAGAEALFSGVGGDQIFEGDLRYFAALARGGSPLEAVRNALRLDVTWRSTRWERVRRLIVAPLVREVLPKSYLKSRYAGQLQRSLAWSWAGPQLRRVLLDLASPSDAETDWFSSFARSTELMDVAEARGQQEVATGMPHVDPFLDASLIEFVASIPPALMFHDHRLRGLYRLSMRGVLPDSLRLRPDKASFEPVTPEILAAGGVEKVADLMEMTALADLGLVEPKRYRDAFDRTRRGESSNGWLGVWPALAVEAFVRRQSSFGGARS
jgi:asparagine synthase (glutamine-hydrolysing)